MKNFLILIFIFFIIFLLIAFLATDSMFIFFSIYLALFIALICLFKYLGWMRGLPILLIYIVLPFLLEYLFNLINLPFFETSTIIYLSAKSIILPITTSNLLVVFSIPTLLICSLFFSQKMKLWFNIKKMPQTFLIITASLLFSLNFLNIGLQNFIYRDAIKWLIIALILNLLASKLIKFKADIPEFFKELPIILYLLIYSFHFAVTSNYVFLLIAAVLLLIYLIALYNEHKYKKTQEATLSQSAE
jgi:hypothetical protein